MGSRHYSASVDVWSVGCIFGELLGRRILFQAQSPVQQLDLITELLGTPSLEDMRHACEGARSHMLRRAPKPPSLSALYTLSSHATHEAVHLLCQMLVFDPVSSHSYFSFSPNTSLPTSFIFIYIEFVWTDFIFAYLLISKRSFRISEYQLLMHWHIRILMRAVYDTIPVCANAVSQHHQDCDNIQMISSPQPLSHLTIYGNGNSHQCNKLKVLAKQLTNYAPTDHTGIYVCIWKVHACTRLTHEFISLRICHENKCFVVVVKSSNMSIVLITWTILWGKQQPFSILFFPDNYCCLFSKISNKPHFDNMLFYIAIAEEMHKFIAEQLQTGRVPLCINPQSAAFKSFAR